MDVYGLMGNPVGHSLSPPIHEAAYDALELDARYVTFEPASDAAATAVEAADTLGVAGLNVTVPFKEDVLAAVDPDRTAKRVGAVNTIDFGTDPPTGHNTDVAGVRRALADNGVDLDGRDVVIVGAGGAGRAVAFAVAPSAECVHVANRTPDRAQDLITALEDTLAPGNDSVSDSGGTPTLSAGGLDTLSVRIPDADLLVNATTVGMKEDRTPVPADLLHDSLTVMDAVYRPLDTRLLREARTAGATTIDGAWMLLYQAAEALELWTGENAPVGRMNDSLRSILRE